MLQVAQVVEALGREVVDLLLGHLQWPQTESTLPLMPHRRSRNPLMLTSSQTYRLSSTATLLKMMQTFFTRNTALVIEKISG